MNSEKIRKKFLEFFEKKGHKVIPSSSLIPENDSSVLFTTAGMQQFKPYYIGTKNAQKDFGSLNVVSIQKCIRTSDIEEVGDDSHATFIEMLGNFSFGGYFKKEAIEYAYEFITKEMNLKIDFVSIFNGDDKILRDEESYNIWKEVDSSLEIKEFGREDNFWGPTGNEGPCGPTTEIYVNGVEIWNIVFNEYYCSSNGVLGTLKQKGVDTGMGLERLAVALQNKKNIYETDLFPHLVVRQPSGEIVADHLKASIFLISDGTIPSNTERGYVLRRLIRRAMRYQSNLNNLIDPIIEIYKNIYPELKKNEKKIKKEIKLEEERFKITLSKGLKEFEKGINIDPFILFSTYGFPLELTIELAKENGIDIDIKDFEEKFKQHQKISRAGMRQKFKGGLAGHSEMEIKYHTATHLLHQALREVLGEGISQKGSNITEERLRFDFSYPEKMTDEEKQKVEDLVNEKIKEGLAVSFEELDLEEAKKQGAIGVFDDKYEEKVKVYTINGFSKEICGGPHVENTSILGHFKIKKEEASSAGVRRIKAVLE